MAEHPPDPDALLSSAIDGEVSADALEPGVAEDATAYREVAALLRSARTGSNDDARVRHLATAMAAFDDASSTPVTDDSGGTGGDDHGTAPMIRPQPTHRRRARPAPLAVAAAIVIVVGVALASRALDTTRSSDSRATAASAPAPRAADPSSEGPRSSDDGFTQKSAGASPQPGENRDAIPDTTLPEGPLGTFTDESSLRAAALVALGAGGSTAPEAGAPNESAARSEPSTTAPAGATGGPFATIAPGLDTTCPTTSSAAFVEIRRYEATLRGNAVVVIVFRDATGEGPFVGLLEPRGCTVRRL